MGKNRGKIKNNQIIVVTPPMFIESNNKERIISEGHRCSSCNGKGCKLCNGTGFLTAVITIEWQTGRKETKKNI